jgi:hypothetical protein
MAKRDKNKPRKPRTSVRIRRAETADQRLINITVAPTAQPKGLFVVEPYAVTEGEFDGEVAGNKRIVRNKGGTTLDRWRANGSIDDRQMAAILIFTRLHEKVFGKPRRVIANYNQAATASAYVAEEVYNHSVLQAQETIWLIEHDIFRRINVEDKWAFENVVLHDMPCFEAGELIGEINRNARITSVKRAVLSVASQIAALVIDAVRPTNDDRRLLSEIDLTDTVEREDRAALKNACIHHARKS